MEHVEGRFGSLDLKVNGKEVKADIDAELVIDDLSKDMDEVAAKMSYWGSLWAESQAEQERVDTEYRVWRAEMGRLICEGADKQPPEWKIKQEVESNLKFKRYKEAVAQAMRNETVLRSVYESFRIKASILQSKGAMARAELDSTSMATRERVASGRPDAVRSAMKKSKEDV